MVFNTTFAHGNGPYSRTVEWAIAVNDEFERRGAPRQKFVVPLVYQDKDRQKRIMAEEIVNNVSPTFFEDHPDEIVIDRVQGDLLHGLMFHGTSYVNNLGILVRDYDGIEVGVQRHLGGVRELEYFDGRPVSIDLRDCQFQLGLNNRVQTGLPKQFYTPGGAGPFDELLERAIADPGVSIDSDAMRAVIPFARRMIADQIMIMSNDPGVFSYDAERPRGAGEIFTPPFIHPPKLDETELRGEGVYLMATGIDVIRESGMYDAVTDLGLQIYAPPFSIGGLPEKIRDQALPLAPNKVNNPSIVSQYARAGWSAVWLSHLSGKGFISPKYYFKDDPEMWLNERGMRKFGLAAVIDDDPKAALERSIELAGSVGRYNDRLQANYGTLDGIEYAARVVVDVLQGLNHDYYEVKPVLSV